MCGGWAGFAPWVTRNLLRTSQHFYALDVKHVQGHIPVYAGVTAELVLPVSEVTAVQFRPGAAFIDLTIFSSNPVALLGTQHHVTSVGVAIMKPQYLGLYTEDALQRWKRRTCDRSS